MKQSPQHSSESTQDILRARIESGGYWNKEHAIQHVKFVLFQHTATGAFLFVIGGVTPDAKFHKDIVAGADIPDIELYAPIGVGGAYYDISEIPYDEEISYREELVLIDSFQSTGYELITPERYRDAIRALVQQFYADLLNKKTD